MYISKLEPALLEVGDPNYNKLKNMSTKVTPGERK